MKYSESGFPKISEIYNSSFNLEHSPFLLTLVRKIKGAWGYFFLEPEKVGEGRVEIQNFNVLRTKGTFDMK